MEKRRILVLSDAANLQTGFARVAQNLMRRWSRDFTIDQWGMGSNGWPHDLPYRIFPAGQYWVDSLPKMLKLTRETKPEAVFILQDPWHFNAEWMKALNAVAPVTFYCPVDSVLRPTMFAGLAPCSNLVAYTAFGAQQMRAALGRDDVHVLPHGVDTETFKPLPSTQKEIRKAVFGDWLAEDDILMTYVGAHQKRKAWVNVIQIFAELSKTNPKLKLLMQMPPVDREELTKVQFVSEHFGLGEDKVFNNDAWFAPSGFPKLTEESLNFVYNATDIFLTTTLGEGWGLPITEALAAGVPKIFVPDHSACAEIAAELCGDKRCRNRIETLALSETAVLMPNDNCLVRYPVDVPRAVKRIRDHIDWLPVRSSEPLSPLAKEWMDWDRIAREFLNIMEAKK